MRIPSRIASANQQRSKTSDSEKWLGKNGILAGLKFKVLDIAAEETSLKRFRCSRYSQEGNDMFFGMNGSAPKERRKFVKAALASAAKQNLRWKRRMKPQQSLKSSLPNFFWELNWILKNWIVSEHPPRMEGLRAKDIEPRAICAQWTAEPEEAVWMGRDGFIRNEPAKQNDQLKADICSDTVNLNTQQNWMERELDLTRGQ